VVVTRVALVVAVCLCSIAAQAATPKSVTGVWVAAEVTAKGKVAPDELARAQVAFGNISMELAEDGRYSLFGTERGTWALSADGKKIIVMFPEVTIGDRTSPARTQETPIVRATGAELELDMGKVRLLLRHPPPPPAQTIRVPDDVVAKAGSVAAPAVLVRLVKDVATGDLQRIVATLGLLGVTQLTLSEDAARILRNLATGNDEACVTYVSDKDVLGGIVTLRVVKFGGGDVEVEANLGSDANGALHQELKASGLTLLEDNGVALTFGVGKRGTSGIIRMAAPEEYLGAPLYHSAPAYIFARLPSTRGK